MGEKVGREHPPPGNIKPVEKWEEPLENFGWLEFIRVTGSDPGPGLAKAVWRGSGFRPTPRCGGAHMTKGMMDFGGGMSKQGPRVRLVFDLVSN